MGAIVGLGYLGINATDLDAWKTYANKVIGAQIINETEDAFRLRLDDKQYRFELNKASQDGPAYFGWDVGSEPSLNEICSAFDADDVEYERVDDELARQKNVLGMVRVDDPCGNALELFFGQRTGKHFTPSREMVGGFVSDDDVGLGHVVLVTTQLEAMMDFYAKLGFRTSERIFMPGIEVFAHFLHCNKREHSLAIIPAPRDGCHHFMLEAQLMRDVGSAYDAAKDLGVTITTSMGQHTNDLMTSFYCKTPGGFDMEYGTGGLLIEDSDSWQVREFDAVSFWGHRREKRA
jgi:3,4-dihydroxy-9,10-secoandrosta-1,3,5(10)-triene-9,17-dione 4,5-dioxygenase